MRFKETSIRDLDLKPLSGIANEWMLITAGKPEKFNTMTASWGFLGEMWAFPTAIAMVRPQRYTFEFMEKETIYTLSFFGKAYRKELGICGSKSGRDIDKMKETGLTPVFSDNGIYFQEAEKVIVCEKVFVSDIKPEGFVDKKIIDEIYPLKDFHRAYYGRILKVLVKE